MGGTEHAVTSISATVLRNGYATKDCPALPERLQPLSVDHHIWLNTPESEVRSTLGPPSGTRDAWRTFDYQGKIPGNCEGGGFDYSNDLELHITNGQITTLIVNQVTSC
jgi:hypothetical protein